MAYDATIVKYYPTRGRKPLLRSQLRELIAAWLRDAMNEETAPGKRKWSQTALADAADVSRETVWRILRAETDVEDETIERLAKALGSPVPRLSIRWDDSLGPFARGGSGGHASDEVEGGEESAFLDYTLRTTRHLASAEQEGATSAVQLRLLAMAEEIGVERFGQRAKDFIERERERIRRGQKLGGGGTP